MEPETKKPWASKTNWVALILAIAAFFPQFQAIVRNNPDMMVFGISIVFAVLRLVTHGKISIS